MDTEEILREIQCQLTRIEDLIAAPSRVEALARKTYSVAEIAVLTESYGIKSYAAYTIRKACLDGRIPEASKMDDGKTWSVSREAVLRILEEGFPPERRHQRLG